MVLSADDLVSQFGAIIADNFDYRLITDRSIELVRTLDSYIILDLETTGLNCDCCSIIEIGMMKVITGQEVARFETLVNPQCEIPENIVYMTDIDNDDVKDAPVFEDIVDQVVAFIGDLPIFAYNARFDANFLYATIERGLCRAHPSSFARVPQLTFIDALPFVRKAFPKMKSYGLGYMTSHLNLSAGQEHRAMSDVAATAALIKCSFERLAQNDEAQIIVKRNSSIDMKNIKPNVDYINPLSPLYNKIIVFTGELSIPRVEAMQLAVNAGAILRNSISTKTNFLVIGTYTVAVGDDGISNKELTARKIIEEKHAAIKIIDEQEFLYYAQFK